VKSFAELRYDIQLLAHNSYSSVTCKVKFQGVSEEIQAVNLHFEQQKSCKTENRSNGFLNFGFASNLEEPNNKRIQSDKWPIPISSSVKSSTLTFGSSYPLLIINP
jgi:hypothetical protein